MWLPVVPPLYLTKKFRFFKTYFVSVENNCFGERNGFRQFSESLEQVEAFFEFFKKLYY
jgi:hypothetical protein